MRRLRFTPFGCLLARARLVTANAPARFKGLSHDEMLVFQLIQQSGNMGAANAGLL